MYCCHCRVFCSVCQTLGATTRKLQCICFCMCLQHFVVCLDIAVLLYNSLQYFWNILQCFCNMLQFSASNILQFVARNTKKQLLFCIPWPHSIICLESTGFIAQHRGIPRHHNTKTCGILWLHSTKRVESHGFIAQQVWNTSQNPSEFVRVCERDTNRHTGVARDQMHFEAVVAS